jgi:hypothetical protein
MGRYMNAVVLAGALFQRASAQGEDLVRLKYSRRSADMIDCRKQHW